MTKKIKFISVLALLFFAEISINGATPDEASTQQVTLKGSYAFECVHTAICLQTAINAQVGSEVCPITLNVSLAPNGDKTRLDVYGGDAITSYALCSSDMHPQMFPIFLESDSDSFMRLDDATLTDDQRRKIKVILSVNGSPISFLFSFANLQYVPGVNTMLSLKGDAHKRHLITKVALKGSELIVRGPKGERAVSGVLNASGDLIQYMLGLLLPSNTITFSKHPKATKGIQFKRQFNVKFKLKVSVR